MKPRDADEEDIVVWMIKYIYIYIYLCIRLVQEHAQNLKGGAQWCEKVHGLNRQQQRRQNWKERA